MKPAHKLWVTLSNSIGGAVGLIDWSRGHLRVWRNGKLEEQRLGTLNTEQLELVTQLYNVGKAALPPLPIGTNPVAMHFDSSSWKGAILQSFEKRLEGDYVKGTLYTNRYLGTNGQHIVIIDGH